MSDMDVKGDLNHDSNRREAAGVTVWSKSDSREQGGFFDFGVEEEGNRFNAASLVFGMFIFSISAEGGGASIRLSQRPCVVPRCTGRVQLRRERFQKTSKFNYIFSLRSRETDFFRDSDPWTLTLPVIENKNQHVARFIRKSAYTRKKSISSNTYTPARSDLCKNGRG